ncbi:hypothetical protein CR513_18411, partial [Mucuna pruriens]
MHFKDNLSSRRSTRPPSRPTSKNWWWTRLMALKIYMCICKPSKLRCTSVEGMMPLVEWSWMTTLPARTIQSFKDLAILFVLQFMDNKAKWLKVVDLFDIRQAIGENLKSYLARFNNATI